MKTHTLLISGFLLLANIAVHAAPAGVIEGLQMPAWLERESSRSPLKPGVELQSGDTIITGDNAKVLFRLEEGSHIKLGQNARINLDKLDPPHPKTTEYLVAC